MMEHRKCTQEMGAEVSRIIDFLNDKPFPCDCGKVLAVNKMVDGYAHDGGYEDSKGKKWWLYLHCPKCSYDWALWKIVRRVREYREKFEKGEKQSSK